jgi:Mg-chelatase subunit ChlD
MHPDPNLDARLADVPIPEGLVQRLKEAVLPSEAEIDRMLAEVAVPFGLLARLREIPEDEVLDLRLREVAVPFSLVFGARRRSWWDSATALVRRASELALAAGLFLVISGSLAAACAVVLFSAYHQVLPAVEPPFVVMDAGPLEFLSSAGTVVELAEVASSDAEGDLPTRARAATQDEIEMPDLERPRAPGPVGQWFTSLRGGLRPMDNAVLLRYGIFTYPQFTEDRLPTIESPRMPRAAGIEPPAVRGYDRAFFVKHGVFPPARPEVHAALSRTVLPLSTRTHSFDEVVRALREGGRPDLSLVRTEDFLAAADYRFPPAQPGQVELRTAAGPSPFGPERTGMLQVAAVAGALARRRWPATHLVLAIDVSASMARGQRLEMVRQGVERLLARLGPRDHVSLVLFGEEVLAEVERASAAEEEVVRSALAQVRPAGGTDLAEAIQRAVTLALAVQPARDESVCVALVTDSRPAMPAAGKAAMTSFLSAAQAEKVRLEVLDLGDFQEPDEALVQWARMLRGEVLRVEAAEDLAWRLVELLYGCSPVAARDVELSIRFRPQAVAVWRLIGHEANAMASLQPATSRCDLRAGQTATALLEIWFQPNDENDVATVELTWRDPNSGQAQQLAQPISRLQFAPTWEQAPITLQQAAIAAETAEVLRGSRLALRELGISAGNDRGLAGVQQAAARVHARLGEREDFRRWLQLVEELERAGIP